MKRTRWVELAAAVVEVRVGYLVDVRSRGWMWMMICLRGRARALSVRVRGVMPIRLVDRVERLRPRQGLNMTMKTTSGLCRCHGRLLLSPHRHRIHLRHMSRQRSFQLQSVHVFRTRRVCRSSIRRGYGNICSRLHHHLLRHCLRLSTTPVPDMKSRHRHERCVFRVLGRLWVRTE